jgi:glucosamine-6-phosphate deaminase
MEIMIKENRNQVGKAAAERASSIIQQTVKENGIANVIFATGASQFEFLEQLTSMDLPWKQVRMFHLDEYIGLPFTHPASFRKYLKERLLDKTEIEEFHLINGEAPVEDELTRINDLLTVFPPDIACVGIGENGHLAFNDPPADFETNDPFIVVELDERCKRQQLREGWFSSLEEVPNRAISMSIRQIMKATHIICTVPGKEKAEAVHNCMDGPVTPDYPASILQNHHHCTLILDNDSASLLQRKDGT